MAENQYQWKNNFNYGGFSDDKFFGVKNSFSEAKGLEIRRSPHALKLSHKLVDSDPTNVIAGLVVAFLTVQSTGMVIAADNTGKVYTREFGDANWTLAHTMNAGTGAKNRLVNLIEYNDYVYLFSEASVHRIASSQTDGDWSVNIENNYKLFNEGNHNAHPAIELNNNLYVGDGKYLSELSSAGVWTYNKLAIFGDEEIVAITYGGSMMKIYATKKLNNLNDKNLGGHKYFWDGATEAYSEYVYFSEPIHCAISNGASDYVIAGLQPWIYTSSGYDFIKLKRFPFIGEYENSYLRSNCVTTFEGNLTLAFQSTFGDSYSYEGKKGRGVWTYGQLDPKYPMSLNFDFPCSKYESFSYPTDTYPHGKRAYFGAIHNSNGTLYVSWGMFGLVGEDPLECGIDVLDTTKYADNGELTSLVSYGKEAASDKAAISLKCAYKKLNPGEKIDVYLIKDLGSPGQPELTIDYNGNEEDRNTCFKEKDIALDIGDYTFIQYKVVLFSGYTEFESNITTPEVYEVSLGFDDIELG